MATGCAAVATSLGALRPSRKPISPSVARSASENRNRLLRLALKMRFSAARYSLRRKLLVHTSCDVGQNACPLHKSPFAPSQRATPRCGLRTTSKATPRPDNPPRVLVYAVLAHHLKWSAPMSLIAGEIRRSNPRVGRLRARLSRRSGRATELICSHNPVPYDVSAFLRPPTE